MEVEHFSHPDHPLIMMDEVSEYIGEHVICSGCDEPISGACYSCYSCFFFLHKRCVELPLEIKRYVHLEHPLILLAKPPYIDGIYGCDLCRKHCSSFVYHCDLCHFDLDIKCAFSPCFFEADSLGHGFAHIDHPLTLVDQQENYVEGLICSACKEPVCGPNYSCKATACNLFLHKKCAELPQEIKRHLHPKHPLLLLKKSPHYFCPKWVCDFCNNTCEDCFVYHCFLCDFNLHIQCAFPPCIYEADQNQGHQFRGLLHSFPFKSLSFTCNACGTDRDERPFMCTNCQFVVHEKCISLRQTINICQHPHSLTHTYFSQEDDDESRKPYCGVCRIQFKSGHGGYQCKDCSFFAHVNCVLEYVGSPRTTRSITRSTIKESMDSSSTPTGALEIEHFSHQHSLILMNEFKDNMNCSACILPISNPFYGCSKCNFFLHKSCSELPRSLQLTGVLLTLRSRADTLDGIFSCLMCYQYCHGFVYKSDIKFIRTCDVRCGTIASSGTITHEGHSHQLFLYEGGLSKHCSACGEKDNRYIFRCGVCDFNLDVKCATLPPEARHEYDKHPLFLTYVDPNDYQFVCIICEKERDPKLWFYRCEECDFDAHPECVLGKHPYIKLGCSYTYEIHPHPLLLIEMTEFDHPACHTCGEPCHDLALECTDSGCDFIIHRKGRCRFSLRPRRQSSFSTGTESSR